MENYRTGHCVISGALRGYLVHHILYQRPTQSRPIQGGPKK